MIAIKIDVIKKEVYLVELDEENMLKSIYAQLECQTFDIVRLNKVLDCYVDDEGLLVDEPIGGFRFKQNPGMVLAGHGLIMGHDKEGNSIEPPVNIEQLSEAVEFVGSDLLPEPRMDFESY